MKTLINFLFIVALWMWVSVGAKAQCVFGINPLSVDICEGDSIELTALTSMNAGCDTVLYDYLWSTGETSKTITVAPAVTTTAYSLTVTYVYQNNTIVDENSNEVNVTEYIGSISGFAFGPFCNSEVSATLTGHSPTGGEFSSPDIPITSGGTINPIGLNPGMYTVNYTYDNGVCGNVFATTEIEITAGDAISFPNPGPLCVDDPPVSLTAMPPGGSYCINGQPIMGNILDPSDYPNGGLINVTYKITQPCVSEATIPVEIISPSNVSIDADCNMNFCTNESQCPLTGTPSGGVFSGDGVVEISPGNYVFDPSSVSQGTYNINYQVTIGGCVSMAQPLSVQVFNAPVISISPINDSNELCLNGNSEPLIATLSGNPTPLSGVIFKRDGVPIGNEFNPDMVGTFSLTAEYTDSNGCVDNAATTVTVRDAPVITVVANDSIFCEGGNFAFTASSPDPINENTWAWTGPAGFTSDASNNTISGITLNQAGIYNVMVQGNGDCPGNANVSVDVFEAVNVTISAPTTACEGDNITLMANAPVGPGSRTHQWEQSTDGTTWTNIVGNTGAIQRTVQETTTYRVTIDYPDAIDEANCGPITSPPFNVNIVQTPEPSIASIDDIYCPNGVSYFFNNTPRDGSFHKWSSPDSSVLTLDTIQDNLYRVQWSNVLGASYTIDVTETVGDIQTSNCMGSASTVINLSEELAPSLAEILYSPLNNTLFYNDSISRCYQWGYFDGEIGTSVELEGEIYQSYVAGDLYDTTLVYWCRAQFNCDDICSTTALFLREAQDNGNPPEETPEQFVLYPNPNNGSFRLEANRLLENSPYEIRITNVLGQVVRQETVTTAGDELDVQIDINNSAGVYYMSLYREGKLKQVIPFVVLQR